jgi:hypothetical protein
VRAVLVTVLIGSLLIAAGCGSQRSPVASSRLETISSVDQFARAFDRDTGHARLVLLLSPT